MGAFEEAGASDKQYDIDKLAGFGNREKILPSEEGRTYYECDIDYVEGTRNGKRIVYSNDGLVYYTEDHYNTFELLYGEP